MPASSEIYDALNVIMSAIIAALAIWGPKLAAKISGPLLQLSLNTAYGELNWISFPDGRRIPAWYYHLKVENRRSYALASNVRVMIKSVYHRENGGRWTKSEMVTSLQLTWQFYFDKNHTRQKNLGPSLLCDIGMAPQDRGFTITTYESPFNFHPLLAKNETMALELIAESDTAQSNTLWIEIFWDGAWAEGIQEMRSHLRIRELKAGKYKIPTEIYQDLIN